MSDLQSLNLFIFQIALTDVPDKTGSKNSIGRTGISDQSKTAIIGGQFPMEYRKQLRMIAAEENTTSQELIKEALNMLFVKKGKKSIRSNAP